MVAQPDQVGVNEIVLRRIVKDIIYIKLTPPYIVERVAFNPSKRDIDGISLFRETLSSVQEVAVAGANPKGYFVARLRVSDIYALGLTLVPTDGPLPGHVIIPEINWNIRKTLRDRLQEYTIALANMASNNVVEAV